MLLIMYNSYLKYNKKNKEFLIYKSRAQIGIGLLLFGGLLIAIYSIIAKKKCSNILILK